MKIVDVIYSESLTGFYFDDQLAIKAGAHQDVFRYDGKPLTPKFSYIRQKGEAISIMIILEDGQVAIGDAAAVQYSGAGGRDPLFQSKEGIYELEKYVKPVLIGKDISTFKELAILVDSLKSNGKLIHTALRYGVTQALLDASAKANKVTMAEQVRKEYNLTNSDYKRVPLFAQCGDDRYSNVDKMIIKRVEVMPHALINHIETKLGFQGEILKEYIIWLKNRVEYLSSDKNYKPIFHIDVYGTIGIIFNNDPVQIFEYLKELEETAYPFTLRIEGPVDAGNREDTMIALRDITKIINENT
ncbi:MAG: methylaspartate ammonia-lyase, partial [Candidatus Izimaplasma sp.]|nr:methylaspartate ammonia-lyase [Candidatus Izimaplasma bacterium]